MIFTLIVDCDNAAFEDDPKYELRRIFKRLVVGDALRDLDVADRRHGANRGPIRDSNGNTVGSWALA